MLPAAPKPSLEAIRDLNAARMRHLVGNVTMTDYHILTNAFDLLNIGYMETQLSPSNYKQIILKEGMERIDGYSQFFTEFLFDDQGMFLTCGAYGV